MNFDKLAQLVARGGRQALHLRHRDGAGDRMGRQRPLFGFSDTWQLVINTGTTVVTFLIMFLIQNTQNRDTDAP